jgi:hypothetical protein
LPKSLDLLFQKAAEDEIENKLFPAGLAPKQVCQRRPDCSTV